MAVSGNLEGKVPVVDNVLASHEQEIYPTTSPNANCIEFEFQTNRNYYVRETYMALKLKFFKGPGNKTYNNKEIKKEYKEEAKADKEMVAAEDEQGAPVPLVTFVKNLWQSIFPMLKCTSAISKITTLMDCMRTSLTFPTTSSGLPLKTREFCTARGTTLKKILMNIWRRFCFTLFQEEIEIV